MILKKIKSLTLLLIIVVAFFDNSAKAQTFPLTNLIVHGWQKIDVLPYGVADTTIYKSVIWNKNNGKLYKIGTMGGGGSVDSLFISYCCGCNMVDGWKALEDTIKIDTCYVNKIIKDSLNVHWIALNGLIQDTANIVHWSDTLTYIATKHDVDTLSNSVYDSLSNHYDLLHELDTGKVNTSGDIMYGGLNIKQGNLSVKGTFNVGNVPLGTDIDSVTVIEDGQLKSVDGSSFKPDSTSAGCFNNFYYKQITGCDNNNLYIKADTTMFSNNIKLTKFANSTTEPLLKVLPSGRIDTTNKTADITITPISSLTITTATITALKLPALGSTTSPVLKINDIQGNIDTLMTEDITTTLIPYITLKDSLIIGNITTFDIEVTLADDGTYACPTSRFGSGSITAWNSGTLDEYISFFTFDADGTILLVTNSSNSASTDTDNNLRVYDGGSGIIIKNRLGGSRVIKISLKY